VHWRRHILLSKARLLQDAQDEGALSLTRAVGDLLALEVGKGLDLGTGRDTDLVDRVVERLLAVLRGDDLHLEPGPGGVDRRDVGDRTDVECVGAEGLGRLRSAADVGELHREAEFLDLTGELERHLGLWVTHHKLGVLRDLCGQRCGEGEVAGSTRDSRAARCEQGECGD
jgi:hypothetical protein